jgi:hypothetical protein
MSFPILYNESDLYHFGYVFEDEVEVDRKTKLRKNKLRKNAKDIFLNWPNQLIDLCLPSTKNKTKYESIKRIRIISVTTPDGTGTGSRSGGRGKVLKYENVITGEIGEIIYGENPDWLNIYNTTNKTYYDTSYIYVKLLGIARFPTTTPKESVMFMDGDENRGGEANVATKNQERCVAIVIRKPVVKFETFEP